MQVVEKDEHEKPIFEDGNFVLYLSENNNGDVCASDMNAGVLVVVDRPGRFINDGTPVRKKDQFSPRNIVTDSLSQIIVTDYNNSCLHILDMTGHFLKCLECHRLNTINALSLDRDGKLWAGLFETGEIKVIE
uniref:Tripartite motif-containing protein 2 n=1 Tax=Magallana gigas TaxID=29159 RepID=K1Q3Q9_MAGGI